MTTARPLRRRSSFEDPDSIAAMMQTVDQDFGVALAADYQMATEGRFNRRATGVDWQGSNADYHVRRDIDLLRLIETARDMARNDPLIGQAVARLTGCVLQDGIRVDPRTGEHQLDADLLGRWKEWSQDANKCDDAGEHDFQAIARLAFQQTIIDGDTIILPLRNGRLQSVEAHRLRTPRNVRGTDNIINGVEVDKATRRRTRYWLANVDVNPFRALDQSSFGKHDVRTPDGRLRILFHLYTARRVSQTRGVTALAPIQYMIKSLNDLQYAHLVQAKVATMWGFIREQSIANLAPTKEPQLGSARTETRADGSQVTIEELEPGQAYKTLPGEKIVPWSSNVPNPEFFQHATLIIAIIAINLDLPMHAMMMDPTKTNFSGWRGAMNLAQKGFKRLQNWMVDRLFRPTWTWKVTQWMAEDPAMRTQASVLDLAGRSIFDVAFKLPAWESIEPFKDAQALQLRMTTGQISPRRALAELGLDHTDVINETTEDNQFSIEAAMARCRETIERFPEYEVNWREFLRNNRALLPAGIEGRFRNSDGARNPARRTTATTPAALEAA